MITGERFEAESLKFMAEEFLKAGSLARVALIDDGRADALIVVDAPRLEGDEADEVMLRLAVLAAKIGAVGVAVGAEAWVTTMGREEADRYRRGDVARSAARREVVVVTVQHYGLRGGATSMWLADVLRPDDAGPSLSGFTRMDDASPLGGSMVGLLPAAPSSAGAN